MDFKDPESLDRRSFIGWMAKAAAAAAAFLGASVGYVPRVLAVHNAPCITPRVNVSGPCSTPGFGECTPSGFQSCMDICNNNIKCIFNGTGGCAKIKCSCHGNPQCCLIACSPC